jgi:hypothetical protein
MLLRTKASQAQFELLSRATSSAASASRTWATSRAASPYPTFQDFSGVVAARPRPPAILALALKGSLLLQAPQARGPWLLRRSWRLRGRFIQPKARIRLLPPCHRRRRRRRRRRRHIGRHRGRCQRRRRRRRRRRQGEEKLAPVRFTRQSGMRALHLVVDSLWAGEPEAGASEVAPACGRLFPSTLWRRRHHNG